MNNKVRRAIHEAVFAALQKVYDIKVFTDLQQKLCKKIVIDIDRIVRTYLEERKK